jgi:lactate racemase
VRVHLEYGTEGLELDVPSSHVDVITPRFVPGLADEAEAFRVAVRHPLGGKPLRETVRPGERVAVVIADITRPLPSERLLPWVFAELAHVPEEHITVVNGTGSHRVQTSAELEHMVGAEVARRYRVVNHDAHDASTLVEVGRSLDGRPVRFARAYAEADRRIVLGFIEPHFMAGFSGGYKGVFPPSPTSTASCITTAPTSLAMRAAPGAISKPIPPRTRFATPVRCFRWISWST